MYKKASRRNMDHKWFVTEANVVLKWAVSDVVNKVGRHIKSDVEQH